MEKNTMPNALQTIRAKCLDCSCGSAKEVRLCPVVKCPLYLWRFGKNPYREKRILTDEQKAACANRLQKYREQNIKGQ